MDTLNISTGEKRISINGDTSREITFNPSDVIFVERFYRLIGEFQTKLTEYHSRSVELDVDQTNDANGIPVNIEARLNLVKEACAYIREKIDMLFGIGTSQTAFGDTLSMDAIQQFFSGIVPFIQAARSEKVQRYTNKKPSKKVLK